MNNQQFERFTGIEKRLGIYIEDPSNALGSLIQDLMSEGDDDQHIVELLMDSRDHYIDNGMAVVAPV